MKAYISPEMDITEFDTEDIITTSGEDAGYSNGETDMEDGF